MGHLHSISTMECTLIIGYFNMLSLSLHAKLKLQLSVYIGKIEVEFLMISFRYLQYKLIGFEYGAPVAVSCPSNYRDRLLMAAACCCCCGLAAVKCSNDVSSSSQKIQSVPNVLHSCM